MLLLPLFLGGEEQETKTREVIRMAKEQKQDIVVGLDLGTTKVCTIIGEAGGNILNLRMHHRQADFFDVDFDIDVLDAKHLTHIAAALRACPPIETVDRAKG